MKFSSAGVAMAGVFAVCVTVGAQSQEPRPAAANSAPSNSAMDRTLSVVGCLQRDTMPGGGPASSSQSSAMFKLTNVQPATGATPSGSTARSGRDAAAPGRAGESSGGGATNQATSPRGSGGGSQTGSTTDLLATEYRLMAMGGVDLAAHVNHKMQLTGTVTPASDPATAAARGGNNSSANQSGRGNPPAGSASGRAAAAPAVPTLHVTTVTMVAASCQ